MNARLSPSAIFAEMLDEARDGLLELDANGTIVTANEAAANLLGRDRIHLLGKPFAAFVALDRRRAFRQALALALQGETRGVDLLLPDGAGLAEATLRRAGIGVPAQVILTLFHDGRPRERAPAPRQHGAHGFVARLPYAVIALNADLTVAFANAHARALLGSAAIARGRPVGDAEIPIPLAAFAERVIKGPALFPENPISLPDGRVLRVGGIRAGRGEPALLTLEDVTAQHRHDRVTREFVRNAAHQLRTPLTGIMTAVEILQSGAKELPEERDRFLEHVERHAARLNRIARGLLVLARAQSGEQVLRLELVELSPLLEGLAADAGPAPGVSVQATCPPGLAALAEKNLMHEALAALVANAVEHTREGTIRLEAREVDGDVEIDVIDNGPGILPEHRARIFEPFYRTMELGEGFGLGLAIAAQAARAMDGHLTVDEAPNGGTTFTLRLPSARVTR